MEYLRNFNIVTIIFELMMQKESRAIPFITKDFTKDTYHLTPEAQSFLSTIDTPISVVTVAGLYRTGKSYLLNRVILNRSGGFGVGPTVNPCTKGLWMWAEPIRIADGRTLLVVDTEGLGALDEQSNHDMKIFCLAVLLSSNFIYNSVGSIDEPALQTLSLVLNLIANIDKESYSSRPSFLWVVRDFSLQLINDKGQNITAKQYLDFALNTQNLKEPQKIKLRKTITESFCERECFTLVKPLIDEGKLQNLDKIPQEELRAQFISQTIGLRKYIFQSLKDVKLNNSAPLKGKDYVLMVNKYLSAINCGQMPNLMDTWSFIRQQKALQVLQSLKESYTQKLRNKLSNRLPMPLGKLQELLNNLRTQTLEEFIKLSYDDTPNDQLKEFLNNSEAQILKLNAKETKSIFGQLLRRQFEPFQKKLLSEYYADSNSYQSDLRNTFKNSIIEKYGERFDLPLAQIQLFAEKKISQGLKFYERRARDELNKTRQMRHQAEFGLQNEMRAIQRTAEEQRRRFQQELFNLEKKVIIMTNEKQRMEQVFQKAKQQEEVEVTKMKRKTSEYQSSLEQLQQELNKSQHIASEQERTLFMVKRELEKEKALSSQREQHITTKYNEQEKRAYHLQQELDRIIKIWETEKREIMMQAQFKIKELIKENKDLSDHLHQAIASVEHEKQAKNRLQNELAVAKAKFNEQIHNYKERITNSNRKEHKREDNDEMIRQLNEARSQVKKYQEDQREWELKMKQFNEQTKSMKSNSERMEAIFKQKIEFNEIEINDLRSKNEELNRSYQKYLESAHHDSKGLEEIFSKKIVDLEYEHTKIVQSKEQDFERKINHMKEEINRLSKSKEDIERSWQTQKKKAHDKQSELYEKLKSMERVYEEVLTRLNSSQKDKAGVSKEKDEYYQKKIRDLQAEVENIKQDYSRQMQEHTQKTQENMIIIKNYSEMERSNLEKRLDEEKQKNIRKLKEQQQDYARKMAEDKQNYDSAISDLHEKINAMEENYSEQVQAMRCDYEIKIQKINNAALEERMQLGKRNALILQEAELTRNNLMSQIEQKTKAYHQSMDSMRRQLTYECEQQVRLAKEAAEEAEVRLQNLRKMNKKTEQSNLLLKSELDKEKAIYRERDQANSKKLNELEKKLIEEQSMNSKFIEELNNQHTIEQRKLNSEIERLRELLAKGDEEIFRMEGEFEQEKSSILQKNSYLETKLQRSKVEHEDLLKKFETTVKSLSNNRNNHQIQKEFDETRKRLKDEYNRKIAEKEETIDHERKQNSQKVNRLITENKSLRDKLLLFEMKQSSQQSQNYSNYNNQMQMDRQKQMYQKKISEMRLIMQKDRRQLKRLKQEKDIFENSVRMQRSKISDRSERHSFINQPSNMSNMDTSMTRALHDNKSLLNRKIPMGTSVKKQQKRFTNADEVGGIMRWQQQ